MKQNIKAQGRLQVGTACELQRPRAADQVVAFCLGDGQPREEWEELHMGIAKDAALVNKDKHCFVLKDNPEVELLVPFTNRGHINSARDWVG